MYFGFAYFVHIDANRHRKERERMKGVHNRGERANWSRPSVCVERSYGDIQGQRADNQQGQSVASKMVEICSLGG